MLNPVTLEEKVGILARDMDERLVLKNRVKALEAKVDAQDRILGLLWQALEARLDTSFGDCFTPYYISAAQQYVPRGYQIKH